MNRIFSTWRTLLPLVALALGSATAVRARDGEPAVFYQPATANVEGDQPLSHSYTLSVTAPAGVTSPVSIVPKVTVLSTPEGVSTATALSFVTLSTSTESPLIFTASGQVKTVQVTVEVPVGASTGDYAWAISTPGWKHTVFDGYAFINARVNVSRNVAPPAVTIATPLDGSTYTYLLGRPTLEIPLKFAATAPTIAPITSIDADLSGTAVDDLVGDGLGTDTVVADGTLRVSRAGIYTVQARATNAGGTSANTVEIVVNVAVPPPAVTIASPSPDSTFYLMPGSTLNLPLSFTGVSAEGEVTAIAATLNGSALDLQANGIGTLSATGTTTLAIVTPGTHTLAVSATNAVGTATATQTFSVLDVMPAAPTVTITSPANGTELQLPSGGGTLNVPFEFSSRAPSGQTISTVTASLNGDQVYLLSNGVGTANASSSGSLAVTQAGTYTLVASAVSAGETGLATVSFTVREASLPALRPACTLEWLPPISLGKVEQGGALMPIKFVLNCDCTTCRHDASVIISIYEVFANGSTSEPTVYAHGAGSPNPSTYSINANGMYHLNFATARGTHRYHIDVLRPAAGTKLPELLGTKEFTTR